MNQTRVKIESLLKISHDVTFDEQNIKGYACLKTALLHKPISKGLFHNIILR